MYHWIEKYKYKKNKNKNINCFIQTPHCKNLIYDKIVTPK